MWHVATEMSRAARWDAGNPRVATEASDVSFQSLCSLTKPKVRWEMKAKERRSWELYNLKMIEPDNTH